MSIKMKQKEKALIRLDETKSESDSDSEEVSGSEEEEEIDLDEDNHLSGDDFQVSNSEEESDKDNSDNDSGKEEGNSGWADSMAKVLKSQTPKNKKCAMLSKMKKPAGAESVESKKSYNFEIEGEIKEEKPDEFEINAEEIKFQKSLKRKIKDQIKRLRVKPSIFERERDKTFKKIATKGVVQLFNAVRSQQKDLEKKLDEAGPIDHKRDHVINSMNKRKFLDVLMGGSERSKSELVDNPIKNEEGIKSEDDETENKSKKAAWSVLRDDFLTGKKMKHWDKDEINKDIDNSD